MRLGGTLKVKAWQRLEGAWGPADLQGRVTVEEEWEGVRRRQGRYLVLRWNGVEPVRDAPNCDGDEERARKRCGKRKKERQVGG